MRSMMVEGSRIQTDLVRWRQIRRRLDLVGAAASCVQQQTRERQMLVEGEPQGKEGRRGRQRSSMAGDGDGELLEGSCLGTSREMEEALGEGEGETRCGWISLLALGVNGGSWADPSRKFRLGRWFWAGWTPSLFIFFF